MNKNLKKTVSVAVASAIVFSMTGCSFLDKSKDEVLEAADAYAKELAACNIGKLAKLSDEDFEKVQEEWEGKLTFSEGDLYTADTATVLNAIADTISYEIDEESVEATKKSGEGSIDVTFTIADYADLVDDDSITDADAFAGAVADAETTEISVTLEFERTDDGEWLGSNYTKVFEKLYDFTNDEFSFSTPVADAITSDSLDWWWTDNGDDSDPVYTNTDEIDGELQIDTSLLDNYDVVYEITYEVQRDGVVIFTGTGYDAWVEDYDLTSADLDPDTGYLLPGTYTITFYDPDGEVLVSDTCTVLIDASAATTTTTPDTSSPSDSQFAFYMTEAGDPFYDGTDCYGWYDGTNFMSDNVYPAGVTTIEFDIIRYDSSLGDVTYEYYYSVDGDELTAELGSFTASAASYNDGDFYECTYSGTLDSGYYLCVVSYNGTQEVMGIAQVG